MGIKAGFEAACDLCLGRIWIGQTRWRYSAIAAGMECLGMATQGLRQVHQVVGTPGLSPQPTLAAVPLGQGMGKIGRTNRRGLRHTQTP